LETLDRGPADPNVLGMMYWTTTGLFQNIRERNQVMWHKSNRGGLKEIWESGLKNYIDHALPDNVDKSSYSSGGLMKLFMPNIVMIDFANAHKCRYIYKLNDILGTSLVEFIRQQNE
jgi:hypothetical protein